MTTWTQQDVSPHAHVGILEFQDNTGEWHNFEIYATTGDEKLVFGGHTNNSFLQSGYMALEDGESLDTALEELLADLETYYNDGAAYVSRIVCNECM